MTHVYAVVLTCDHEGSGHRGALGHVEDGGRADSPVRGGGASDDGEQGAVAWVRVFPFGRIGQEVRGEVGYSGGHGERWGVALDLMPTQEV